MELLFYDPTNPNNVNSDEFLKTLKADLVLIDPDASFREANIGTGADYPVVLVQIFVNFSLPAAAALAGPVALFFLGSKIKSNADAWLDLAKRFKSLFAKKKPLRIDAKAGFLIALETLNSEGVPVSEFDVSIQTIEHVDLSAMIRTLSSLDRHPDATYQIAFYRYGESHIFVIESDGSVVFRKHFSTRL